ncbi:diguanylate cyclase [Sphingomonas sp.]|uniref:GGDEF domain-containing protein n=1 Tax=Sphingomonas sp. TaxID=28214 RepID=UPI0025DEE1AE|nr:diguanylate cyclase [Sphingomonas sp.]
MIRYDILDSWLAGAWLRGVICALFALVIVAAPAHAMVPVAEGQRLALAEPCVALTDTAVDAAVMLKNAAAFDCKSGQIGLAGPITWGIFRNLSLASNPADPWEIRHTLAQARDEAIFVHYTDGRVLQVADSLMTARRAFAPNQLSFRLPAGPGIIDTILIRADGMQNERGVAARPELVTGHAALASDIKYLALYGVLAGAVFALLVFNFSLFVVLRMPFLLFYCLSALMMLFIGACWSGTIFAVLPGLDPTTQVSLTLLAASIMMISVSLFMLGYIERKVISRPLAVITLVAGLVGLCSSIIRVIDMGFAWQIMDRLTYGSMVVVLIGNTSTAAFGWARGSKCARNYLIAWSIPFLLGMFRSIWALGFIEQGALLVEISPLVVMALEALMSAVAVGWRIGSVRNERDEAWAMQEKFRQIAEVDVLTGLLTRRAFLRRIEARTDRTQAIKLILIDIDQFKLINDRHGHLVGDDVLMLVADVLRTTAPETALIGRIGGEEFAVVIDAEPVDAVADRLCKAVAATATSGEVSVTISAGVAESLVDDDVSWRLLYYAADQALYRSKNGGRNRVSHAPRPIAA